MPASNRVVCLLSGPLAAVGRASQPGVEGELRSLPLLDAEAERATLESALREGCEDTGRSIELQIRYATLDALRSAVTLGARVVHFSGHGHPSFLCFEDGRGGAAAASPEQLRRLVSAGGCGVVRLVVVNCCHSQRAGDAFVEAGVPHVVAVSCQANNDGRVSDRAATAFCRAFYLGVIAGRTVKQAFEIGCASASGSFVGDKTYVLLPEAAAHDERIFADAPLGVLQVTGPRLTPTNAPAKPTFYLGRDAELFCLVDAMLRHRLTSVTGAFGCGKSALAAAAAHYLADRGEHFEAVVWVKVRSRERLVEDVVDAVRRVLSTRSDDSGQEAPDPTTGWSSGRSTSMTAGSTAYLGQPPKYTRGSSSLTRPAVRRRVSNETDEAMAERIASFSSLVGGTLVDEGDDDDVIAEKAKAATFLRTRRVLVVLDAFEKLAAPKTNAVAARADCQRALASLLSTASKAHVVVTCCRGSGLGRSTSVTERVVKIGPLAPTNAARLLLLRSPELARRATNAKAARSPRTPPHELVTATAAHPVLRRLAGNPFAIALAATLLNALFEAEDAAQAAAHAAARAAFVARESAKTSDFGNLIKPSNSENEVVTSIHDIPETKRSKSSPPHQSDDNPLEPLDRLLKVLEDSTSTPAADDIARLRDEIKFVTSQQPSESDEHRTIVDTTASCTTTKFERLTSCHDRVVARATSVQQLPLDATQRRLDRRTFDILATSVCLAWIARLVFDAVSPPSPTLSLRLDAVAHLFLDLALLVVLASLLPPNGSDEHHRHRRRYAAEPRVFRPKELASSSSSLQRPRRRRSSYDELPSPASPCLFRRTPSSAY